MFSWVLLPLAVGEIYLRTRMDVQTVLRHQGEEDFFQYVWLAHRRAVDSRKAFTPENPRLVYSETLGWRPRPNYRARASFNDGFNLNSQGVRGVKEYSYERSPGDRRIVVIGDSFTFGSFDTRWMPAIPDEAVYTAVLERSLPGVSVVNLGVDGYGSDQMLLYLREEGFKYNPDLVIISLYVDDLSRSTLAFRDYAKPRFVLADDRLLLTGVPVLSPEQAAATLKPRLSSLYLWAVFRSAVRRLALTTAPLGLLEVDRLNAAILETLRAEVANHGARLLVLVIPDQTYARRVHRSERFLESWCARNGVALISLRDTFLALPKEQQKGLYVGHWKPLGHEVAARAVRDTILKDNLLQPLSGIRPAAGSGVLPSDSP